MGVIVYLVTSGDGSDGDEWNVHGIYATPAAAEIAKTEYESERKNSDGSTYRFFANEIEEWPLEGAAKKDIERFTPNELAEIAKLPLSLIEKIQRMLPKE